jgi:hypothetical protein
MYHHQAGLVRIIGPNQGDAGDYQSQDQQAKPGPRNEGILLHLSDYLKHRSRRLMEDVLRIPYCVLRSAYTEYAIRNTNGLLPI